MPVSKEEAEIQLSIFNELASSALADLKSVLGEKYTMTILARCHDESIDDADVIVSAEKDLMEAADAIRYRANVEAQTSVDSQEKKQFPIGYHDTDCQCYGKKVEHCPVHGSQPICSDCGEPQFDTPSGITCKNGHGDAPSAD